ncbi:MAG: MBL fold metallo-hydrolase [Cyanobacteria bacterium P01_F01_bin.150]
MSSAFSSQLACHENVRRYFGDEFSADVFFDSSESQRHMGDIEVIYTPGHTDNNLCFRYQSPHGKAYLFIGDTLYQDHGEWNTLVVVSDRGNSADLKRSLLRLRKLEVDVVICNVTLWEAKFLDMAFPLRDRFTQFQIGGECRLDPEWSQYRDLPPSDA